MTNSPQVQLVDLFDRPCGSAEKLAAHRQPLLHRAFSVFLYHEDALLLQQRAWQKYHCGGLWANTCCSHPQPGEALPAAAALFTIIPLPTAFTNMNTIISSWAAGMARRNRIRRKLRRWPGCRQKNWRRTFWPARRVMRPGSIRRRRSSSPGWQNRQRTDLRRGKSSAQAAEPISQQSWFAALQSGG